MKVNNKWTTDENAYIFHIQNKNLMREAVSEKGNCKKLSLLKDLTINLAWINNENNEGDPPNMELFRQLWADYSEHAKKIGIPLWERAFLEKTGLNLVALIRQDSAYYERIGGIMVYFIYNSSRWKGHGKSARLAVIKDAHTWWNEEDKRERTRQWIDNIWCCVESGYQKREFWTKSIDFVIDWIIDHKDQIQIVDAYDPRKWFGREKGKLNMSVHAGLA